jgi:glucokinase
MSEIIVGDIGGTHARFALAQVEMGRVESVGEPRVFKTAEHETLEAALAAFAAALGRPLPRAASLAVACPVTGEVLKLTNNPWVLRPADMRAGFASERLVLVNDFGAVARAVAELGPGYFEPVCGPIEAPPPGPGVTTVIGPGTGLGVAQLVRAEGRNQVIETEGGHIGFAPQDRLEDQLVMMLQERHGRVSVERVLSGSGLGHIASALAASKGVAFEPRPDPELWGAALEGGDSLAAEALERFCRIFGAIAGDLALAHGADDVVLAGGLGARLAGRLSGSTFREGFISKGRFEARMSAIPVRVITHPQPGLYGAAAAFTLTA